MSSKISAVMALNAICLAVAPRWVFDPRLRLHTRKTKPLVPQLSEKATIELKRNQLFMILLVLVQQLRKHLKPKQRNASALSKKRCCTRWRDPIKRAKKAIDQETRNRSGHEPNIQETFAAVMEVPKELCYEAEQNEVKVRELLQATNTIVKHRDAKHFIHFLGVIKHELLPEGRLINCLTGFSLFMTVANSVFLGVAEDFRMKYALVGEDAPDWVEFWESVFAISYALEMIVRIATYRLEFFHGKEMRWNLFETCLAIAAVVEILSSSVNFSAARPLRIFRALRVLRVTRVVPYFNQLRLMVDMIGGAFMASAWAVLLLALFNFILALLFMGLLSDEIKSSTIPEELHEEIKYYYGSVIVSLTSLIGSISGGTDWFEVADPLREIGLMYCYYAFVICIILMAFGLLNILTAVVVESTKQAVGQDVERVIEEERAMLVSLSSQLKDIMEQTIVDVVDGVRTITCRKLKEHLDNPQVRFYMESLGISRSTAMNVFRLLHEDSDGGEVDIDTFVNALVYYHNQGAAKYVDVATLLTESAKDKKRWATFAQHWYAFARSTDEQLTTIRQRLELDEPLIEEFATNAIVPRDSSEDYPTQETTV